MNLKLSLGSMDKFKPRLATALALLLAFAILLELFALYRYGYLNISAPPSLPEPAPRQILDIKSYMNLRSWVERNNSYAPPAYGPATESLGRDNPLLEYR